MMSQEVVPFVSLIVCVVDICRSLVFCYFIEHKPLLLNVLYIAMLAYRDVIIHKNYCLSSAILIFPSHVTSISRVYLYSFDAIEFVGS